MRILPQVMPLFTCDREVFPLQLYIAPVLFMAPGIDLTRAVRKSKKERKAGIGWSRLSYGEAKAISSPPSSVCLLLYC